MSTHNWQLPPEYITGYLEACKKAATDDKAFANFRQDPFITTVIENTTKEWADQALERMGYTPTMVRYWYTTDLICRLIPALIFSVVEIGGGYGGMCQVMSDQNNLHDYTIIDLPEPLALQRKYLHSVGYDASLQSSVEHHGANLCISWCAWSELSYDLRVEYAEKVISKCDHFFICSNYNKAEDLEILSKYFTGIKEYSDDLVQNVIYV